MSTILLVVSTILFHLPFVFFKDTARRLDRMNLYQPQKAGTYIFNEFGGSGIDIPISLPIVTHPIFYLSAISSLVLSLLPIFKILDFYWFVIIVVNTLFAYLIAPYLAFAFTPFMSIFTRGTLNLITYVCIILGFITYIGGVYLN